jgi:hypothetical protein
MKATKLILVFLFLYGNVFAQASEFHQAKVGDRIRITSSKASYVRGYDYTKQKNITTIGNIISIQADTVVVLSENEKEYNSILYSDILKLEISTGKKSNTVTYALGGLLGGAALGGLIGYFGYSPESGKEDLLGTSKSESALNGAKILGLTGFLIGFVSGMLTSHEKWIDATLNRNK